MGCGDSRDHGEEEDYLKSLELALGFGLHNVRHLDLYIRKYASDDDMNPNQCRLIGQKLGLQLTSSSGARTAEIYFSNLLYYQGTYSRTLMLLLAIMHGSGQAADRARLLFEIFDLELTERISVSDMNTLVTNMTKIALEQVDILVNYEMLDKKPAAQLREYLRKVNSMSAQVDKELKKLLFPDENALTLTSLLRVIKDPQVARLLTSSGIRTFALELFRQKTAAPPPENKPVRSKTSAS
jgi:hypothetical protein